MFFVNLKTVLYDFAKVAIIIFDIFSIDSF